MRMRGISVDYDSLANPSSSLSYDELVENVNSSLPLLWQKAYRKMAQSPTSTYLYKFAYVFLIDTAEWPYVPYRPLFRYSGSSLERRSSCQCNQGAHG